MSGEATAEELAMLDRLIEEDPEMAARLDAVDDWWTHAAPRNPGLSKGALQRHLQRMNQSEISPGRRGGGRRGFLLAAGIAASLAGLAFFVYHWTPQRSVAPSVAHNSISTKSGSKSKIQLPDGSQVWLNSDSRLIYSESFNGEAREVQLCGEAYFDVAKDPGHPFVIHTPTIDVRVLGTTLNVRSYSNEKTTEAVLIHGSVEVILHSDPAKKIILKPNDKLVVPNGGPAAPGRRTDADSGRIGNLGRVHFNSRDSAAVEVLWVKNKLAFDEESLETVALKLERWFNVKVVITDDALKHQEFSGVFEEEALPQVMEALRLTGNFHYTIQRRVVTIRP
jgi:ferric-dicitrate binding protein FerR (iron transport regulator)